MHIFIISTQWNWLFFSVQWHLQQRHANRTHSFLFSSSRKTRFCTKKKFFRQFADERARKSSLRRVYEFKWVLSKSHSKAILIQNNMHLSLSFPHPLQYFTNQQRCFITCDAHAMKSMFTYPIWMLCIDTKEHQETE